jgi:hypothetical protein
VARKRWESELRRCERCPRITLAPVWT